MSQSREPVLVSEVGPRDGLQSLSQIVPTPAKLRWIESLAASGLSEIEVGSFVSGRRLPQMSDCAEIVEQTRCMPGLVVVALVPNLTGAERAVAAGVHKMTVPVSASNEHSLRNVGKTTDAVLAEVARICSFRDGLPLQVRPHVEVGISTAFGCPFEGAVPEERVAEIASCLAAVGVDSIGLSDTIGVAEPTQVKRLFKRLSSEVGSRAGSAHFHNTLGLGLANVVAALDSGVRTFDSSHAGLGGCPYAPGAAGNIVTEDLVYLLERMGLSTGIDLGTLIRARALLMEALPGQALYGHVAVAAIPGWTSA